MPDGTDITAYTGPAIIELMGHRKTAGMVTEVQQFGASMLRIDTPDPSGAVVATQFYGGSAIYCLTPCTDDAMHAVLALRWSLPDAVRLALPAPKVEDADDTPWSEGMDDD